MNNPSLALQLQTLPENPGVYQYYDKDEKPQFEKIEKKVEEVSEHKCPTCENGDLIRRKTDKGLFWWGCSNYKDGCKTMFYDKDGKPDIK